MAMHDMSGLPDPELNADFYRDVPAKRLVAWFLDALIIVALSIAFIFLSFFTAIWVLPLVIFAVSIAYRTICLNAYSATLGMRFVGIEIRDRKGNRVDSTLAFLHSAVFTSLFIIPLLIIASFVVVLVTPYKQGLHDLPFGTTAIRSPG